MSWNRARCLKGRGKDSDGGHSPAQKKKTSSTFWTGCLTALVAALAIASSRPANALPSFARQTGQPCGTCHTDFPGLTPFGRQFKIDGYTTGGGPFQTTPFGNNGAAIKALNSYAKKMNGHSTPKGASALDSADANDGGYHGWVPPISMMTIVGFEHTQKSQDPAPAPFKGNDNLALEQFSLFWGGAVTKHIGAFAQMTYEGTVTDGSDPADRYQTFMWHWDNVDLRYVDHSTLGGIPVTFGVTATNNPSMADPWNTMPAWGFPYASAQIAPSPGAATMVDGSWGQQVAGVGGYAWFDDLVYVQLSGFTSLDHNTLTTLGNDPFDAPGQINGVAPYWRLAIEPHWGRNWLEIGTFGMYTPIRPWLQDTNPDGFYTFNTYEQTNKYTDVGFDTQYQYQGDNYWLTLRGTYIHEDQSYDAATGVAANSSNTLNTARLYGSFAYGNDNRVVLSGQYFDTWGSTDATLYANNASTVSPDSNGFTAEIAYIPFISSHSPIYPWANARIGLQYTWYNKFDGTTDNASDNNTLFAYLWLAM